MRSSSLLNALLLAALAVTALPAAMAADPADAPPTDNQVIVPQVDRRPVKLPRIPSNDFEAGLFTGTYGTQNFGSSLVVGVRGGYHITEDFFVEAAYGQTKVSDASFRQILPGGVFADTKETLKYYNVSAGVNIFPGEAFFGRNTAKATVFYLVGGIGATRFLEQRRQTFNVGFGTRLFLADWVALQVDMRDHVFSLDLLGKRQSTQNLEMTTGVTFFF